MYRDKKKNWGRGAAVTQKYDLLGLGDHWTSWSFFWSLKDGTKVAALCKGGFGGGSLNKLSKKQWSYR